MKKNIFFAAGAILLTTVGAFAGRASSKFAASAAWFKNGAGSCVELSASAAGLFSNTGTHKAQINTGTANAIRTLLTSSACTAANVVYFKD